jgi:uncharacterized protein (TIGR02145 family)
MKNRIYFLVILSFLNFKSNAQTIVDIDGNIYNSVTIGAQTWMQENLKTTRFNNGIAIPTTSLPVTNDTTILYQWSYNQDTNNINIYGRLYTWNVIYSNNNVCPNGWRVPNNLDWEALSNFLGGGSIAGGKMKEMGTVHWLVTDSTVNNSSGFTGLGSGSRGNPSGFSNINQSGSFWSSTPFGSIGSFPRGNVFSLVAQNSSFINSVSVANNGKACRCIKDETTGIDNSSFQNEIQIFPNPATNRITVSLEEIRNYHLSIFDLLGNTLHQQKLIDKINYIEIDFLPKGTYLIKLITENHVVSYKFIKT